ncbi:MAG: Ldh family oxidoreductase [Proteobacteria bacterium]|nr:Ldh family oxidoreductase [Pseudomonadota bacterium]
MSDDVRGVPAAAIRSLVADCFSAAGMVADDAACVAELMVEADLTGADGHGVMRLAHYMRRFKAGGFNRAPNISVTQTAPATALVDGDNGIGHLVVSRATRTAMTLARAAGVAWVGVRRSNHAGAAGIYAAMPAAEGMIGIYAAVASANHMAASGSAEPLLGTNPLAIGVPTNDGAMVFDMATTIVSYGTIKKYAMQGRAMPPGWLVSATTGEPITDPKQSAEGLLLPVGGYKGSGLALMLGVLAGVLNGAAFGRAVIDFNAEDKRGTNTGQFILALDVARFMPMEGFRAAMDVHLGDLRAASRLPGVDAIRLPGDRRRYCRAERLRDGVPLPPALVAQLDDVAQGLGVKTLAQRLA